MFSGLKKLAQNVGVTSTTTKKMTPNSTDKEEHQTVCARIRCIATVPASIPFIKCFNITKPKLSIGRSIDTCDLILDSRRLAKMISRVHCVIEREDMPEETGLMSRIWKKRKRYRWKITDQSVNGIFVNDVRVSTSPLNDGDVITLGGGMSVKMGQSLQQPMSEFIFRWEVVDDEPDDDDEETKESQTPAAKRQRHALIDSESVTQDYAATDTSDNTSTQANDGMTNGHDEDSATLDFDAAATGTDNSDNTATQANDAHGDGAGDDTATQAAGAPNFGDDTATQAAPYDDDTTTNENNDEVATP